MKKRFLSLFLSLIAPAVMAGEIWHTTFDGACASLPTKNFASREFASQISPGATCNGQIHPDSQWVESGGLLSNVNDSGARAGEGAIFWWVDVSTITGLTTEDKLRVALDYSRTKVSGLNEFYVHLWGYVENPSSPSTDTTPMANLAATGGNMWEWSDLDPSVLVPPGTFYDYNLIQSDGLWDLGGTVVNEGIRTAAFHVSDAEPDSGVVDFTVDLSTWAGAGFVPGASAGTPFTHPPQIADFDYLVLAIARDTGAGGGGQQLAINDLLFDFVEEPSQYICLTDDFLSSCQSTYPAIEGTYVLQEGVLHNGKNVWLRNAGAYPDQFVVYYDEFDSAWKNNIVAVPDTATPPVDGSPSIYVTGASLDLSPVGLDWTCDFISPITVADDFCPGDPPEDPVPPYGGDYLWNSDGTIAPGNTTYVDRWIKQFPPIFLPTDFDEVVVWLDAQDPATITADGADLVSTWFDKSGNDHHFTSWQAGFEPEYNGTINGYPAVDFGNGPSPAEGDVMRSETTPWPGAEPINDAVLFVVGISDVINEQGTLWHMEVTNGDRWLVHAPWQGGQLIYDAGPAATAPYRLSSLNFTTAGTPWILTLESSVANSRQLMARDGVILAQDGDAYGNTLGDDRLYLCGYDNIANTQDAKIGEVIVWKGPITVADRQLIEGYLAWKWGLVENLDPSHPYKTTAPAGWEKAGGGGDPGGAEEWCLVDDNSLADPCVGLLGTYVEATAYDPFTGTYPTGGALGTYNGEKIYYNADNFYYLFWSGGSWKIHPTPNTNQEVSDWYGPASAPLSNPANVGYAGLCFISLETMGTLVENACAVEQYPVALCVDASTSECDSQYSGEYIDTGYLHNGQPVYGKDIREPNSEALYFNAFLNQWAGNIAGYPPTSISDLVAAPVFGGTNPNDVFDESVFAWQCSGDGLPVSVTPGECSAPPPALEDWCYVDDTFGAGDCANLAGTYTEDPNFDPSSVPFPVVPTADPIGFWNGQKVYANPVAGKYLYWGGASWNIFSYPESGETFADWYGPTSVPLSNPANLGVQGLCNSLAPSLEGSIDVCPVNINVLNGTYSGATFIPSGCNASFAGISGTYVKNPPASDINGKSTWTKKYSQLGIWYDSGAGVWKISAPIGAGGTLYASGPPSVADIPADSGWACALGGTIEVNLGDAPVPRQCDGGVGWDNASCDTFQCWEELGENGAALWAALFPVGGVGPDLPSVGSLLYYNVLYAKYLWRHAGSDYWYMSNETDPINDVSVAFAYSPFVIGEFPWIENTGDPDSPIVDDVARYNEWNGSGVEGYLTYFDNQANCIAVPVAGCDYLSDFGWNPNPGGFTQVNPTDTINGQPYYTSANTLPGAAGAGNVYIWWTGTQWDMSDIVGGFSAYYAFGPAGGTPVGVYGAFIGFSSASNISACP